MTSSLQFLSVLHIPTPDSDLTENSSTYKLDPRQLIHGCGHFWWEPHHVVDVWFPTIHS